MSNSEIARLLRNVAAAYTVKDEQKFHFQIIAYQRAADSIEHATSEVKDLWKEGKLDALAGIGPSIKSHLDELFKTGRVRHFDWVTRGLPASMFKLLEIPTFGPKKAYKLAIKFNLKNAQSVVGDLEKIAKSGRIATLEGFGEKSEQDIVRAIAEYKQGLAKITRMVLPYAYEIASKMVSYLKKSPGVRQVFPLGSLRRMVATVGDIDIAVASSDPKSVIEYFVNYPAATRVIERGDRTASIITTGGVQIDLMVQSDSTFGALLQHFTGSKHHNIHLREYALKKGLSLSEYGIKDQKSKIVKFSTEEAFYKALGLQFIPPELREDQGEIEAALRQAQSKPDGLPKLVELGDIKGDLHIHSDYPIEPSHDLGRSSMAEMLEKAEKLNYQYLGFSEHNPSISKHNKKSINLILSRRKKFIEQLKVRIKDIHIVNLLEVDILTDGKLALDEEALEFIDGAVVSVHSSFDQDREKMTERVLKGLSHPKARILAHPTGRLLQKREGYELDWNEVFNFCKRKNKALEINAYPIRLDLPDVLVREAVNKGVKLIINTDSHEVSQMDLMRYGVAVAR
ncbi:DNA polymerase III, partial [Candidatus Microgenomates bacterium]|nr:DNA polymerase III [Candidatus Microgenomates bacterium]